MKGKPAKDIRYDILARETELYSGADIENVVENVTEKVLNNIIGTGTERAIEMQDLLQAIKDT